LSGVDEPHGAAAHNTGLGTSLKKALQGAMTLFLVRVPSLKEFLAVRAGFHVFEAYLIMESL